MLCSRLMTGRVKVGNQAVRDAMRAWRFDDANRLLGAAEAVLSQRTAIASEVAATDLTLPPSLQAAFEGSDGFASAI